MIFKFKLQLLTFNQYSRADMHCWTQQSFPSVELKMSYFWPSDTMSKGEMAFTQLWLTIVPAWPRICVLRS